MRAGTDEPGGGGVVELLRFHVQEEEVGRFILRNEAIWTPALRDRPGFIRREILRDPDRPEEIMILVHWRSRADLEAFPDELEAQLDARMGDLAHHHERRVLERLLPGTSAEP